MYNSDNNCSNGVLFVVSGPSGVGKGTVCEIVHKECPCVIKSVSVTTRAPRKGEQDGVNYFFKTKEQYDEIKDSGGFLETFEIYGNFYGTPKQYVIDKLALGYSVLLEIDVQGAMQVKKQMPDAVLIFLIPPSIEALKQRLIGRKSESAESLKRRIDAAKSELNNKDNYDYVVVNDTVNRAAEKVIKIIKTKLD